MEILKVENGYLSNNYIIFNNDKAVLVDCSLPVEKLKQILGDRTLCGVFLTHGHFDHFYSLKQVLDNFNCNVYMNERAYNKLGNSEDNASSYFNCPFTTSIDRDKIVFVKDNQILSLIDKNFEILEAFGHTDDSILIKIDENVFTGDFVFAEGYGRTDFKTGNFNTFKKYLKKHLPLLEKSILYYGHN